MRKLEINITKAVIESFRVQLKDGKPEIDATIALLTDGGKKITSYTISTDAWDEKNKFELPISAMPLIGELARLLEGVVVRHCRQGQKSLPTPEEIEA